MGKQVSGGDFWGGYMHKEGFENVRALKDKQLLRTRLFDR